MEKFLENLEHHPPATDFVIAECESRLGAKLPAEYVEFLRLTNGGEGFIGENEYLISFPVEQLCSLNHDYHVQEYAPGLLIFGSSGGGEAYGFDTRSLDWPIVRVPFVGMDWSLARRMGSSFGAFLQRLYES
jgi:hypothetical protein